MDEEIQDLEEQLKKKQEENELAIFTNKSKNEIVTSSEQPKNTEEKDKNSELVDIVFRDGIKYQVANNQDLQDQILTSAEKYVNTKAKIIETNVDSEQKEAEFNNKQDACESYGFNEKRTPIWAIKFMNVGYSIMLAIWLFIGSFTFMPVIFIAKKIQVGLKKTWLAILFAVLLYFGITVLIPLLVIK